MKLSEHFTLAEFLCHCGCGKGNPSPRLIAALEELRALVGKPIHTNCGYRCPKRNRAVGGAKLSYHMKNLAADIKVEGMAPHALAALAEKVPAFCKGGIGIYPTFVHVDVRQVRPARWTG